MRARAPLAQVHALKAEAAAHDAEMAAGAAAEELKLQRSQLEAQQLKMASMGRMLHAQLQAGQVRARRQAARGMSHVARARASPHMHVHVHVQAAHDSELRLREQLNCQLTEQHAKAEALQQQAYDLALERAEFSQSAEPTPRGGPAEGAGAGGAAGAAGAPPPASPRRGQLALSEALSEAEGRMAEEVRALRGQLGASTAKGTRLQSELEASEAELAELHDGYTLVWEELQHQREAMAKAMAQCEALQAQVDASAALTTPRPE